MVASLGKELPALIRKAIGRRAQPTVATQL
jgi:hypothetical protein